MAAGSAVRRKQSLAAERQLTVIGRDNLADALPYAKRFKTVIFDELSSFKTRDTNRWKTARKLTAKTPHIWGLTGTPSPNGLLDLWAQIFLLDKGERLGDGITKFRSRYFMPGHQLPSGVVTDWIPLPETEAHVHHILSDICISMTSAGRVHLPEVTYNRIKVPLDAPTRRIYTHMKEDLVVNLDMLGGEIHTAQNAAVLGNKLCQITAGAMYVDDADIRDHQYHVLHREKINVLREIVEGTGSPVLVFRQYRFEEDLIRDAFAPGTVYTADTPDLQRKWNNGEIPVLVAHPASIGHGLNLQYGGHTIVWTSLTWSLEEWQQGNKRLLRQGQAEPVIIHTLESPRTVDPAIARALRDKTRVQDALMEHLQIGVAA